MTATHPLKVWLSRSCCCKLSSQHSPSFFQSWHITKWLCPRQCERCVVGINLLQMSLNSGVNLGCNGPTLKLRFWHFLLVAHMIPVSAWHSFFTSSMYPFIRENRVHILLMTRCSNQFVDFHWTCLSMYP